MGYSVLLHYVDYTRAHRTFWGAVHSTHHLDTLAALEVNASLLDDASRFLASGRVAANPSRPSFSKRSAPWQLEALRCHGPFGAWCSDAGFL